jgi:hypothetical protein
MHTFQPTGRPECAKSTNLYGEDWHGPYMGFDYVELVVMGHNRKPPMKPPFGQHYDRWFYSDGLGDWKWERYQTRTGPDAGAAQTIQSGLPVAWHNTTWTADRALDYLRGRVTSRLPCGSRSRIHIIRSTLPSPGRECTIPPRSTFRSTARRTSIAGLGGTARR